MLGKKNKLALLLYKTGLLSLRVFGPSKLLTVINYHRIRPHPGYQSMFDDGVFGPDQQIFEKQIRWLSRHCNILSETDLISIIKGERRPPKRGVMITFDDGYIDNYTLACPILCQYNVPAIFFIPTGVIEERRLGWWDLCAYLLKKTSKKEIEFEGKTIYPKDKYKESIQYALQFIYQSKLDAVTVLERLASACSVALPEAELQSDELMSWDQLREVASRGIAIGGHSHSHTILSSLNLDLQKEEIRKSKEIIEARIERKISSMSYPIGNYRAFSSDTQKIAKQAGYDLAFSFLTGMNKYSSMDPMDIRRIAPSNYFPRFVADLLLPEVFNDNHNSIIESSGFYDDP